MKGDLGGCLCPYGGTQADSGARGLVPGCLGPPRTTGCFSLIEERVRVCSLSGLSSFVRVREAGFFLTLELHLPSVMPFKVPALAPKPLEIFSLRVC